MRMKKHLYMKKYYKLKWRSKMKKDSKNLIELLKYYKKYNAHKN